MPTLEDAVWSRSGEMLVQAEAETLRIELTGVLNINAGDVVVPARAFPGRQGRVAFAMLAANHRPVSREELAEALWPRGGRPPHWRRDLSALVSRLRALLAEVGLDGGAALAGGSDCYELRLPAGARVDVDLACHAADEAARALRDGDSATALRTALEAAEIGRRRLLPDEHGEWVTALRHTLRQALGTALDVAAAAYAERGEIEPALRVVREAVEEEPFREAGYRRLIRLQLLAGERAAALGTYHRCRELLASELGVDPAPETQAVYHEALRSGLSPGDPSTATGSAERRADPGTLPVEIDAFVGREREIETVATALAGARLVTLTGVGGVGKSRLAREVAARVAPAYSDGVWLCELTQVAADRDVAHALEVALGSQQQGLTPEQSLLRHLRTRQPLVILDNCEHVLGVLPMLVDRLLRGCPSLSVLATSRERLSIPGEHVLDIAPLPVPTAVTQPREPIAHVAAVELFRVRAASFVDGFTVTSVNAATIAEICRRLDGLPLAIELAAARVRTMSVADVVRKLDARFRLLDGGFRSGPAHGRTLHATVDWSYDMLSTRQQRVFDSLSVFAGRFTSADARAVCGEELGPADVDETITALADKSMIVADTGADRTRYRLLETLRDYGRARLVESGGRDVVRARHAAHFVGLAERAARDLHGSAQLRGLATLRARFDDIRAAQRWCIERRDQDRLERLLQALHWYGCLWAVSEVFVWADEALPTMAGHTGYAVACATAGWGAWAAGDRTRATELGQAGFDVASSTPACRYPLDVLGSVALFEGRLDEAADIWEQALTAARAAGDVFYASHMAANIALACGYHGDHARAQRAAELADELAHELGNPTALAWAKYAMGELLMDSDPQGALALLDEGLRLARTTDNRFVLGVALVSASSLRGRHGDPRQAMVMMLEAITHWQRAGNRTQLWTTVRNVVELFVRMGQSRQAALLMGAVRAAATAAPVFGSDAARLAAARDVLVQQLGEGTVAELGARGAAMQPEALIRYACAELADRGPAGVNEPWRAARESSLSR